MATNTVDMGHLDNPRNPINPQLLVLELELKWLQLTRMVTLCSDR